jgi:hypothetical protein
VKPLALVVVLASASAWADPAERCASGVAFAQKGDVSRAALYLDGCDEAQLPDELAAKVARAMRELRKKIEASELSVVEIVTRPAGLQASIDAMPDETFVTPATIYIAAGTYQVHVGALKSLVTTKPRSRSVMYIDAGVKPVQAPKDGKVDFNEDSGGEATQEVAPPPEAKHKPLMPCKYTNSCTEHGDHIDDPLERHEEPPPVLPRLRGELLVGAAYADALAPSFGIAYVLRLQDTSEAHPFLVLAHGEWVHGQGRTHVTGTAAFGKVIAAPDTAWLSIGLGINFDTYSGLGGAALLELALRRLPIVIGAHYEQSVDAMHDAVFGLEVGYALRML